MKFFQDLSLRKFLQESTIIKGGRGRGRERRRGGQEGVLSQITVIQNQ